MAIDGAVALAIAECGLGFAAPPDGLGNFTMDNALNDDAGLALLAVVTLAAFDVYGCTAGTALGFELNLE